MSFKEEDLFWRTAHFLIVNKGYRILQRSKNEQELWLEKTENKEAQIIRLLRRSLDWSNWLQQDRAVVATNGERIRRRFVKRELTVMNLYFTPLPPVDNYHTLVKEPFIEPAKQKVKVFSHIVDGVDLVQSLHKLEALIGGTIFPEKDTKDSEEGTAQFRNEALIFASKQAKAEREIFHHAKPFFTYIFLALQILIFLLMEIKGSSQDTFTLIEFGAKFNPLIIEGEWWRFFTPVFLHIGMLHLLMNSLALYYLGPLVEQIYGNLRFLLIYLLAGFSGVLASFIFSSNLSAGASGAIFGLFGALLFFGTIFPRLFFQTMGMNMLVVLGINLVFGFVMPGIDNAGHIGGLIGGFAAAGIVYFPRKKRLIKQGLYLVITAGLILGMLQFGFNHPTKVVGEQSVLILAQAYIENGEYEQAFQVLDEYKDGRNESAEILFLLSVTETKLNDFESAKKHLHRVVELDSGFHEAYYNLSLIYLEQESFEEARGYAENAVQLQPNNQDYQKLLENITALAEWFD